MTQQKGRERKRERTKANVKRKYLFENLFKKKVRKKARTKEMKKVNEPGFSTFCIFSNNMRDSHLRGRASHTTCTLSQWRRMYYDALKHTGNGS